MDSSESLYEPLQNWREEDLSNYRPGGLHPVCLRDAFHEGRYVIYHKIGCCSNYGSWIAKDNVSDRWVTLKILSADYSVKSKELENLRTLMEHAGGELSSKGIIQLLDDFEHRGPNGVHQCLVFELFGLDLWSTNRTICSIFGGGMVDTFGPETLIQFCKQILRGLAFVHDAGLAHGQFTLVSVVITLSQLANSSVENLFEAIGTPVSQTVVRRDGQPLGQGIPKEIVGSANMVFFDMSIADEELRIVGFDRAFSGEIEKKDFPLVMEEGIRYRRAENQFMIPPEWFFEKKLDYHADLWAAGCAIYGLAFDWDPPFISRKLDYVMLREMIDFLGYFPEDWRVELRRLATKCEPARLMRYETTRFPQKGLIERFDTQGYFDEPEHKVFLPVIQGLLTFWPANRASAKAALDLLNHLLECIPPKSHRYGLLP